MRSSMLSARSCAWCVTIFGADVHTIVLAFSCHLHIVIVMTHPAEGNSDGMSLEGALSTVYEGCHAVMMAGHQL